MKVEATELKQMQALKKAFTRLTNTDSWEEAVTNFPAFATEEQLRKFLSIDVKKKYHKILWIFVPRAKHSGTSTSVNEPDGGIAYKSCTAYVVESKVTGVNGQMLKSTAPSFSGATLSILRID